MNERIRITPVRVIDENGEQLGIIPTFQALTRARDLGLDLVEISPSEKPPVCKIMDYGKFKYNRKKKQRQQHKHTHEVQIKEVRLRPKIDKHDRDIKLNRARGFLEQGDKVQFTMMFRGRENAHREIGRDIFTEIVAMFEDIAKVEQATKALGRRMTMVLSPDKTKVKKVQAASDSAPKPQAASAPAPKPQAASVPAPKPQVASAPAPKPPASD